MLWRSLWKSKGAYFLKILICAQYDEKTSRTGRIGMALSFIFILSLCPLVKSSTTSTQVFLWEQCYRYLDLDYLQHAVSSNSMTMVSKNGVLVFYYFNFICFIICVCRYVSQRQFTGECCFKSWSCCFGLTWTRRLRVSLLAFIY